MQWQKKLYQHEETPPAEVWLKLQQEIADDPIRLRSVLNEFESEPPVEAWPQIVASINLLFYKLIKFRGSSPVFPSLFFYG